jgi:hypothetical protein
MLDDYKKHSASWAQYEQWFLDLMAERQIETNVSPETLDNSALLCSEAEPPLPPPLDRGVPRGPLGRRHGDAPVAAALICQRRGLSVRPSR